MMKRNLVILFLFFTLVLFAVHHHKLKGKEVVKKGKFTSIKGELIKKEDDWYLKKDKKLIEMHFGPEKFLTDKGIEIKPVKNFTANGYLYKDSFAITSFTYKDTIIVLRNKEGKALWEGTKYAHDKEEKHKIFYVVDSKKCIGCKLCVINCPVNAIQMVHGRAVIDVDKCIGCGICANGNGGNFKGCPVGAISKSE